MLYFIFLYALLSHPSFTVRESATAQLLHLVDRHPQTYGPRLSVMLRESAEPEVLARGRRIVAVWDRWRVMSYVPKGIPYWPVCDCYPSGVRPALQFHAIGVPFWLPGRDYRNREKLRDWLMAVPDEAVSLKPPAWTRYRRATENYARHLLYRGTPTSEVDDLMQEMWEVEREWESDCGVLLPENGEWRGYFREGGFPRP